MAVKSILDYFPDGWTPRDVQVEILNEVDAGLSEGKEYFFVNAPTGSGKSLINLTIARYLDDAYIMTPLKSLQRQYINDFSSELVEVKGRSNYQCPDGRPCHKGLCVEANVSPSTFYIDNCGHCPWVDTLRIGEASKLTLFNFYSYICQTKFARRFTTRRGSIIIDEAHNLIETLRNLFDIRIRVDSLEAKAIRMPRNLKSLEELILWARDVGLEKVTKLSKLAPEDDETNKFRELLFKLTSLVNDPDNYVLGLRDNSYMVRRKGVGDFFNSSLAPYGEIKVFSSATLLNPQTICKYLSIPWNKVCYISKEWPMSPDQGPVCTQLASTAITYKTLQRSDTLDRLAQALLLILEELHPEDRGVIHCVSHGLKERLLSKLNAKTRRRLTEDLGEYKRLRGKVLIGPSLYEGLDLADDLCRFQVLLKVPLPSVSDPLVSHLGFDHPEIKDRVVTTIAQAYGRGLRHSEDFCTFYILDKMINYWRTSLPDYMRSAILAD